MDFEVSAELVGIYLEDAREHLAVLDDALLRLERSGPDPEVAASLLGPLHTLKGNSGMIGFVGIKDYVHRLEDAFARVRDGSLTLEPAVLQQLFEGASALREAIESSSSAGREERDLGAEKEALAALLAARAAVPSPTPLAQAETARSARSGMPRWPPHAPAWFASTLPSSTISSTSWASSSFTGRSSRRWVGR